MTRRTVAWTLGAVVVLAFGLRIWFLNFGLPGIYNPDELPILNRALAFAKGDPNPHNFLYPTLQFYALFVWEVLFFAIGRLFGLFASLAAFQQEYFSDPSRLVLAARAFTAVCGTLTVLAVYRFGARLYGTGVGVAAAMFLAVAPFAVRDAHYVKLDVPVTLLTALTHASLAGLVVDPRAGASPRRWILAGLIGGLAISTHYYVAFLVVSFVAVALVQAERSGDAPQVIRLLSMAGAAVIVGFLIGTPFIVVEPGTAIRDLTGLREVDIDRAVGGGGGAFPSLGPYLHMLWRDALGWPVALATVGGTIAAFASDWRRAVLLVAFPVPFLMFVAHTVPESRYLNAMLPMLSVSAAFALVRVGAWLAPSAPIVTAGLVGAAAVPGFIGSVQSDRFFGRTDTRTLAREFIERRVPPGASVLIQPYSAPLHPSREGLLEALRTNLGDPARASVKFQLELAVTPYPAPAYRLIYLGDGGTDPDKLYLLPEEFQADPTLGPLKRRGIKYVVLKRTNVANPETEALEEALLDGGRRLATFSPYYPGLTARTVLEVPPFFHNTASRIDPALERPGPIVEVWQIP